MYYDSLIETPAHVELDSEVDPEHNDRDHAHTRPWSLSYRWIYGTDTRFPHTPACRYNMFSARMIRSLSIPGDRRGRSVDGGRCDMGRGSEVERLMSLTIWLGR